MLCIVQARSSSKRFPNKIFKKLGKVAIIERAYLNLKKSSYPRHFEKIPIFYQNFQNLPYKMINFNLSPSFSFFSIFHQNLPCLMVKKCFSYI